MTINPGFCFSCPSEQSNQPFYECMNLYPNRIDPVPLCCQKNLEKQNLVAEPRVQDWPFASGRFSRALTITGQSGTSQANGLVNRPFL